MNVDARALLALLGGARRRPAAHADDALAVAVCAADPHVDEAMARTRVSPFTTDVDLRVYLPGLSAERPDTIVEVVETSVLEVWRARAGGVDAVNVDVVLGHRDAADRLGDDRAMRVAPLGSALGPGVQASWRRLTFPEHELVRRFGATPPEAGR
ncbi:hypothetical protein ACFRCR_06560 [Oerskovia sp. NPDC056781]|uniref:hypothetical protein n=1 Tax=Oerskovia sp. NPDC056781 TaxID=3345942 RepID=UPI00366E4591